MRNEDDLDTVHHQATSCIGRKGCAAALATMLALACSGASHAPPKSVVWVFEEPLGMGDRERPIANATVVVDTRRGETPVTATTDADGRAVLAATLPNEGAVVSAISPEHTLVSVLNASPETARVAPTAIGKPASDLVIVLPRLDRAIRASSVELRGAITGKSDAENVVDLSASGLSRLSSVVTQEAAYALRVPRDRAFFLVGHEQRPSTRDGDTAVAEHLSAFRIEVAPRLTDGVLDIDVAAAAKVATRRLRVRAEVPSMPDGPFSDGTRASASVLSADSQLLVAPLVRRARSADGRAVEIELVVADVDTAPERVVTRSTFAAPDGSRSVRVEPGVVADGATLGGFPLPPSITEANRALTDPIDLEGFPSDADLRIEAFAGGELFWIVLAPGWGERGRTVRLPDPPVVRFPVDVQLIALSFQAQMDPADLPGGGRVHRRVAVSRDVVVRRN